MSRNKGSSVALTLTADYQTLQLSGVGDLVIERSEDEALEVIADFVADDDSQTEDCQIIAQRSHDGIEWESDAAAPEYLLPVADIDAQRTLERYINVPYARFVRFRARVRDTDGTPGGTDDESTVTIHYFTEGKAVEA